MFDSEVDKIRARDRKRCAVISRRSKTATELSKLLAPIIYQRGINNGNIYADWLADQLLATGRIQLVAEPATQSTKPARRKKS